MKKLALGIVMLILLVATVGCASPAATPAPAEPVAERSAAQSAPAPAESTSGTAASSSSAPDDTGRMIVRTADLSVVVTDAAQAQQSVVDAVQAMGGYVADSSAWREGEQLRARITVRVPAEELDALLASIKALAVRVQQENVKGQDVTEEYTDLDAQLTNLEATEKELRELLAEVRQKTQKAEDVLQVYRELTNIRGEIERTKGRMQYLSAMTAMATANVELVPDVLAKPVVEPGWRPLQTLKDAGRALVNALKGLVNALIWIVIYALPLLVVIAIPVVLVVLVIRWLIRRARRRPQAPTSGQ